MHSYCTHILYIVAVCYNPLSVYVCVYGVCYPPISVYVHVRYWRDLKGTGHQASSF